jgi:hypothetical protein
MAGTAIGILIVILGVIAGILLFFVLPTRRSTRRATSPRAAEPRATFSGGATWKSGGGFAGRASWPLVQLKVFEEGLTICPARSWVAWTVPHIDLQWADIRAIDTKRSGIRIVRADSQDAWVLFQADRDPILHLLSQYPVQLSG